MAEELTNLFPHLSAAEYAITSPEDHKYNCIAWAAGSAEARRIWWPAVSPFTYWPVEPREETVPGFVGAFVSLGYEPCAGAEPEAGYEKLAIYADESNVPTHMARQLPSGSWTSKLGELEDIEHVSLDQLSGDIYGRVVQYLRRKTR